MNSNHHNFSENYMVLRPENVSFFNIFCMLWNHDMMEKAFVHYPSGKEQNVPDLCRLFFSLLSQKLLQSVAKPMSWIETKFEMWMNLVSCNRNIFILLLNALRGKVVMPTKESATFSSTFAFMDKRVHLDKNIKPDHCRYYSHLSAMAAKLSYENGASVANIVINYWKMELIGHYGFWNDFQEKYSTQATMIHDTTADPNVIIVAFRGTEPFDTDAWCTDFDISWYEINGMGKIHGGFMKALGLLMTKGWPRDVEQDHNNPPIAYYTIRENLRKHLEQNDRTKFILTGHSMGGALAILFSAVLAMHEETELLGKLEGVYTFGQPRVGDEEFKEFMERQLKEYGIKYLRFVYSDDVVPRFPPDNTTFSFKHSGTCVYYDSCYNGKIVEEEPDKNYYLSAFASVPRFLNAWWELLRSIILPYTKGPDFAEGLFLKIIRWYGLIFPGLSAHNPQDYVNMTRLGSDSLYLQLQTIK